ncbi:uncharacterized protein LOC123535429 [Mercenaria mercenaria]|uniref:uncharacterized protein LOC123535429 n=1 Tax=Mercenaria mercenaria TaxID=6596 RepID=UPI00234E3E82|nr:uncharacterized protein LOC123535429 [Mercenaria mercenaria]
MGNTNAAAGHNASGRTFQQLNLEQQEQYSGDSREGLVKQYGQLTTQLHELKQIYDDIYSSAVQSAATEYLRSKNNFFLRRKQKVKAILKGSVGDAVMDKFLQPTNECSRNGNMRAGGLLAAARQFAEAADKVRVFSDRQREVEHLTTEQLKREIRQKDREIKLIKRKLEELHNELMSLKERYEETKQIPKFRRYSARKEILKSFIKQNTTASPESPVPVSGV